MKLIISLNKLAEKLMFVEFVRTSYMKSMGYTFNSIISKVKKSFLKPSRSKDALIGEVLLKKNVITHNQRDRALYIQKERIRQFRKRIHFGRLIVELGYAPEAEVVEAINEHFQLSVKTLSEDIEEIIRNRPRNLMEIISDILIPIWVQLAIASIFIIVLTIFSLGFVILNQQKEQLYQQTVKIGKVSLNYFTNNARIPLLEDNILRLNTLIKEAAEVEGILYAVIVNHKGQIMAHTDHNKIGKTFENFKNVENTIHEGDVIYFDYFSGAVGHVLNLKRKILFKGKDLGEVHVGISLDFIERLIYQKSQLIIVVSSVIIFFGVVIAVFLGLRFSRPISKLVVATQQISNGNYQHRVELKRNDELGNLAAAFNQMSEELLMKSLMQDSFGKYVGSEVLNMIMANPETAWLKGHRREATILFTDIRGFTGYSETREPEDVIDRLNQYFEVVSSAIVMHGGYIDKFIGDAVLGVFGAPVYHDDHMQRALKAAFDIQKALSKIGVNGNRLLQAVGIGINSGVVVAGNIGSQDRMEYTVIGDTVNVAHRINSLAGPGDIIISKNIFEHLEEWMEAEALPPQLIKGRSEPITTYKVLNIEIKKHAKKKRSTCL